MIEDNLFTIKQVEKFWDKAANEYDDINNGIGNAHFQRYYESIKYLNLQNKDKILNIWSRTGNAIKFLTNNKNIELYNLEVSKKMIEIAQKKYPEASFEQTNLTELNFPNNYFDKILSLETLEHAPSPDSLLKEFYRILKPGGILAMSLPPRTAEIPLRIYELFFKNHGEGPHKFIASKKVKAGLKEIGFNLLVHKGTLLIPAGPNFAKKFGEYLINKLQNTPIKELGIRQFYIATK